MKKHNFQVVNGFILKILGMFFMTIDHVGIMLMKYENLQQISTIFRCCGRLALPIFLFLIVEGIRHTSNVKKYFIRLGILELIFMVPMIIFEAQSLTYFSSLSSPITDLLIVALVCYLFERKDKFSWLVILPISYMILCFVVECVEGALHVPCLWLPNYIRSPYSLFALLLGLAFYFAKPISVYILKSNSNTNGLEMTEYQRTAENIVSAGLLIVISVALYAFYWAIGVTYTADVLIAFSAFAAIPLFLYSGERGYNKPWFKYGSYVYVCAHLVIIYLIFGLI